MNTKPSPGGPLKPVVGRQPRSAEEFAPLIGRAYRLRLGPGNPNNCTIHVRAIVDTYQVVVAVHGKHRGWYYRIEDLRILRMWRAEGKLKLAPNAELRRPAAKETT